MEKGINFMDKVKIVILERNSVGVDTPVDCFEELGEVTCYPNTTTAEEVRERTKDADIIVANKARLNEESLRESPNVKLICEFAPALTTVTWLIATAAESRLPMWRTTARIW